MKRSAIFLFALLSVKISLYAQQISLSGSVTDANENRPLVDVIVLVKNSRGNVLKYTQTDKKGQFSLVMPDATQCTEIQFSLMSYKKQVYSLNGENQDFHIRLEQTAIQIKEVIVKARRIEEQGDTLIYNVTSFANQQDRSIGDVLKKMPGINVDKEGKIKYNGIDINKFYIEGKDLLEGRYGIATKGISYKDVGQVEVMENHQPIKVMNGLIYSNKAGINLKLKENAKAQWIGNFKLQGGYTENEHTMWNADIFNMIINKKFQSITTLKSNNTGENIKIDLKNFYSRQFTDESISGLKEYIFITPSIQSNLEEKRTLFNQTHLFSNSQLWEMRKEWQLKTQIDYLNNSETSNTEVYTTYFIPDKPEIIIENEQQRKLQNLLNIATIQETNRSHTYLKHALNAELQWNNIYMQTKGTHPNYQKANLPVYKLKSNLNWMQRFKNQLVTFNVYNLLHSSPQKLYVNQSSSTLKQIASTKVFYTNENASYNLALNNFILSIEGGIAGLMRSMKSELTGMPKTLEETCNDIKSNYLQLYTTPQIRYSKSKWDIALNANLKYYHYSFGKLAKKKDDILFSPHLHINWKITSHIDINLSGNISSLNYNIDNFFNGFILSNYRTLKKGYSTYAKSSGKSISGGIHYKHPLNELFANLNILYSWDSNPFQSEQHFIKNYILYSYKQHSISSNSCFFMANVNKGVDLLKGIINLDINCIRSKTSLVAEKVPITYHTITGNVNLDVNGEIFSWFNWYYKAEYGFSILKNNIQDREVLDNWQHSLNLNFFPYKNFVCIFSGEFYHNKLSNEKYKDLLMGDARFIYKWKDCELSVQVKNIFNKKGYEYNIHNELTSISFQQQIRGREFLLGFSWRK